jgi:hypothetical protein
MQPEHIWLAWPVFQYRVSVVAPTRRQLDVFERIMLMLAVAGPLNVRHCAELLQLDAGLIADIILMMQRRGWIDGRGRLVEQGRVALREDFGSESALQTGVVLQDAFSGRLWPGVHERLRSARVIHRDAREIRARFGTHDNPVRLALRVLRATDAPAPPSSAAILEAFRRSAAGHEEDERMFEGATGRAQRIDPQGELAYLCTAAVADPAFALSDGWAVLDPMTGGLDPLGTAYLKTYSETDGSLKRSLEHIRQPEANPIATEAVRFERENAVRSRLSTSGLPSRFIDRLTGIGLAIEEVQSGLPRVQEEMILRSIIVDCCTIVESLLGQLNEQANRNELTSILTSNGPDGRIRTAELLQAKMIRLGFQPIPPRFVKVTSDQVRRATIPGQVALACHAADSLVTHPVRELARQHPEALARLADLLELRNTGAGHAGIRFGAIQLRDAIAASMLCEKLTQILGRAAPERAETASVQ